MSDAYIDAAFALTLWFTSVRMRRVANTLHVPIPIVHLSSHEEGISTTSNVNKALGLTTALQWPTSHHNNSAHARLPVHCAD